MSKCENCIHYDMCDRKNCLARINEHTWDLYCELENVKEYCKFFKDKSLFVELPCEIGTDIYLIVEKRARHWHTKTFKFIRKTKLTEANAYRVSRDFGKTIFLDRAEAERKLSEENK